MLAAAGLLLLVTPEGLTPAQPHCRIAAPRTQTRAAWPSFISDVVLRPRSDKGERLILWPIPLTLLGQKLDGHSALRVASQIDRGMRIEKGGGAGWKSSSLEITAGTGDPIPLFRPRNTKNLIRALQLLEELAPRARNIDTARYPALAIFHALLDAGRLAALGAIRALAGVHHLFTVCCFCDLCAYCHGSFLLISSICAQRSA